jgi:integrase
VALEQVLDRTRDDLWVFRYKRHKTRRLGHVRQVFLTGEAIDLLTPHLEAALADGTGWLFSPRRETARRLAAMRERRRSKVQPSQRDRSKESPKKQPGERYRVDSYCHAVYRACDKAGVGRWHPHQLRHAAATEYERLYGWETARVLLGHHSLDATRIYVDRDYERAVRALLGSRKTA